MNRHMLFVIVVVAGLVGPALRASADATTLATSGFALADKPGESMDVLLDGRIVARYMYAHDMSTPQRRDETFTAYLHVFDAEGQAPITKGPGGWIPYHRGIFVGWMVLVFQNKTYDLISMKGGSIAHQKFLEQRAGADEAAITAELLWTDAEGQTLLQERRTMTFRRGGQGARLAIDLATTLAAPRGKVWLGGDWVHNGVQYRGADETIRNQTAFTYPRDNADPKADSDYPWVGMTYSIKRKQDAAPRQYSVVQMNHPANPKGTKYGGDSAARLGICFNQTIAPEKPLTVKYRFVIADGPMPARDTVQKWWASFAAGPASGPATQP